MHIIMCIYIPFIDPNNIYKTSTKIRLRHRLLIHQVRITYYILHLQKYIVMCQGGGVSAPRQHDRETLARKSFNKIIMIN